MTLPTWLTSAHTLMSVKINNQDSLGNIKSVSSFNEGHDDIIASVSPHHLYPPCPFCLKSQDTKEN